MKRFYFLLLFCAILLDAGAQKCTLVFRASGEEVSVRIYKPIDDMPNAHYISDKLDIEPNTSVSYELDVNDFGFVMCEFSTGFSQEILLEPRDSVEISCDVQKLSVSGSNAEGHNYYRDRYTARGLGYYCLYVIDPIFERYLSQSPIRWDSIGYHLRQELIVPCQADLKKMEMSGSISPRFAAILSKNLYFACCMSLEMYCKDLLRGFIHKEFKPSQEDIRNILSLLSQFYDTPYATSGDIKKMPYYLSGYYFLKYKYMDEEAKEKLTAGYDKDCFGGYAYDLLAPDSLQLKRYSTLFIENLLSGSEYFNHEKMLNYLSGKFPDSEYVAIIKKMRAQSSKQSDKIIFIDDSISSMEALMQMPGIKGNYAYIDLWSTSCVPCMFEFQYNEDIHKLLTSYHHVVPVYISIDNDRVRWESRVNKYQLKGYNVMASKYLQEDIGMKVYKEKRVGGIPRYLLLDPEGNIVNDNLPRPSRSTQLKLILDKVLK